MIPYKDDNPTLRTPYVTLAFIAANVIAWLGVQGAGSDPQLTRSICQLGAIPADLLGQLPEGAVLRLGPRSYCQAGGDPAWYTALSSMFLHGGWAHLIGNMWFLWIFGNNVEDSMGRLRFAVFYLVCGLCAVAAQVASGPGSTVPMVGASGAIGGVMGAYVALYPRVRVHLLVILGIFITTVTVPAFVMLGYWLLLQVIGALPQLSSQASGVAFWAHIGGFVAGVVLVPLVKNRELVEAHRRMIRHAGRAYQPRRW